jgi:hypothetical protein
MALISLQRLKESNQNKYPSNTLIDYYDIIHKLMESLSLSIGLKATGLGAHKELIDLISEKYSFDNESKIFLQELRDYRNRISYEGFNINKNYLISNNKLLEKIISKLLYLTNYD